ncbi:uncharacterized protein LOC144237591 [Crocuta crocuta]
MSGLKESVQSVVFRIKPPNHRPSRRATCGAGRSAAQETTLALQKSEAEKLGAPLRSSTAPSLGALSKTEHPRAPCERLRQRARRGQTASVSSDVRFDCREVPCSAVASGPGLRGDA